MNKTDNKTNLVLNIYYFLEAPICRLVLEVAQLSFY